MVFNGAGKKIFKLFCLKRKLRLLEKNRDREIMSFILANPSQAAKTDNLEQIINSETLRVVNVKIRAARRLLSRYWF